MTFWCITPEEVVVESRSYQCPPSSGSALMPRPSSKSIYKTASLSPTTFADPQHSTPVRKAFPLGKKSYSSEARCVWLAPWSLRLHFVASLSHTVPAVSRPRAMRLPATRQTSVFVILIIRCGLVLFFQVLLSLSQVWARERRPIPSCWGRWLSSCPRCPAWTAESSRSSPPPGCHTGSAAVSTSAPSGSYCWGSRTPPGWCRWRPSPLGGRRRRWRRAGSRAAPGGASRTACWRRWAAASTERRLWR